MNVEYVIAVLALALLAGLTIPWLVRLCLSSRPLRRSFLKFQRSRLVQLLGGKLLGGKLLSSEHVSEQVSENFDSETSQSSTRIHRLPVRYLSPEKPHSPLRLVPWDARGILEETEKGFVFRGNDVAGDSVSLDFPSDDVQINYQKGNLLWDGGFSWCVIERDGEKHFFTSDIGGSEASSEYEDAERMSATGIYQSITKRYI